ncbi:hypothetical protein DPMN_024929 [Dreissena polymorpha]|uniref:Uncharacterized protein n=1 Tax=Dreissena polymorpha TaxID=45954 RepID=A0A9D4RB79_DREPO|nr:hypothetical protein DPMN_024929 [Dreissena polymorpha]
MRTEEVTDVSSFDGVDTEMPIFIPGPLTKFMELQETLAILKGPHVVLQEIPTGRKDGMFFVVDNSDNIRK